MTELSEIFDRLGLLQYLERFIDEGFDTWEVVLYATESDLEALGLKLGHRRKLQKEIAENRGVSIEQIIGAIHRTISSEDVSQLDGDTASSTSRSDKTATGPSKRKYRRHPKPDTNAPERAPSAYVIFSNKVRAELKPQKLNFTDIAKIVGERWQVLDHEEKERYENQAAAAKDRYNNALAKYKRTSPYRKYQQYLTDFKARNTAAQTVSEPKRPKLDTQISGASDSGASAVILSSEGEPRRTDSTVGQAFSPTTSNVASPDVALRNMPFGSRASSTASSLPATPVNSRFPPAAPLPVDLGQRGYDALPPSLPRILPLDNRDNRPHISTLITDSSTSANPRRSPAGLSAPIPPASFLRQDTSKSSLSSNISRDSGMSSVYTPNTPSEDTRSIRSLPPIALSHTASIESSQSSDGERRLLPNLPSRFVPDTGPHTAPVAPGIRKNSLPRHELTHTGYSQSFHQLSLNPEHRDAQRMSVPALTHHDVSSQVRPPFSAAPLSRPHTYGQTEDISSTERYDGLSVLALAGRMVDQEPHSDRDPSTTTKRAL